ncbi:hypothetical protein PHMEG_00028576 [Phytophthora megakarya]|uniref:Uncharacterized protein n=1 Tax=Phytophthora megakarya TaxID=4795 RepID=A0A225V779_9STRA|nr:hypothetical protein PHMEG_00037548 [Phytophthora megakarya]OWY95738.1 hypothetical protein PHMEG_00034179 [Phytophthora megakarya]OWZ00270.1 hypothetical protein PHMEG_00028576 [Phytophthora megakarya]
MKCARFVRGSTTTIIASHFERRSKGSPVTKSIEMLLHRLDGILRGCRSPACFRCEAFIR